MTNKDIWKRLEKVWNDIDEVVRSEVILKDFVPVFCLIILKVSEEAEINGKDYVVVVYISLLMKVIDELKSSRSRMIKLRVWRES